jgi:hypothetical protein
MATLSSSTKKSAGGRISTKTPGVVYSKTAYHIPESTHLLLQYASMVLGKRGEPIHTLQPMLEKALSRYLVALCKQKNFTFPEDLLPTDNPELRASLLTTSTTSSS